MLSDYMGLRGCVDAWGAPVKKPELAGMTERFKPVSPVNTVNKPPVNKRSAVNKPAPTAAPAAPVAKPAKPATDRAAYLREYMRARRAKAKAKAKAKASKPG